MKFLCANSQEIQIIGNNASKISIRDLKCSKQYNVPVKSKLQHPPRHLTPFPFREGGNLMNLVFPMIVPVKYQSGTSNVQNKIMYQSNRSFNIPPSPGIPLAFDAFSFPGWREFHELSPPGVGHLITTHRWWAI